MPGGNDGKQKPPPETPLLPGDETQDDQSTESETK